MTTNLIWASNTLGMKWRTLVFALFATPATLAAQELRGTVTEADGKTPASGVVLVMLHETRDDSIVARTVSSERGVFALKAPKAMTVRLRALRIGYVPMTIATYTLGTNDAQSIAVTLSSTRVQIATFDVRAKNGCDVKPDGARLVSQLFDQAKTALLSSITTVTDVQPVVRVSSFLRNEDRLGRLVGDVERSTSSGSAVRQFTSVSPAALAKNGYIVEREDGTTMYAPDGNVIISDSFLAQHCMFLVEGTGETAGSLGIGFRPTRLNLNKVDVQGTLWLNPKTAELQFLEYGYKPVHPDYQRFRIGGRVDYAKTKSGLWFVSKWAIRMPRVSGAAAATLATYPTATSGSATISGIQIVGGEVLDVRAGSNVLFASADPLRAGSARSDATGVRASTQTDVVDNSKLKEVEVKLAKELEIAAPDLVIPPHPPVPTDPRKALIYVTDARQQPIQHATVLLNGGVPLITDERGGLVVPYTGLDSLQLVVKRIGFSPYSGMVGRSAKTEPFELRLGSLAQSLSAVKVKAKRETTPLERTHFYEHMMEVQRGAIVGEFFTPEQLDARVGQMSAMLRSSRYVRFSTAGRKVALLGRPTGREPNGCVMNVFIDGIMVRNIFPRGDDAIDDLMSGSTAMAVEIYPSSANAPAAFLTSNGDGQCGVVAIWTGGRR